MSKTTRRQYTDGCKKRGGSCCPWFLSMSHSLDLLAGTVLIKQNISPLWRSSNREISHMTSEGDERGLVDSAFTKSRSAMTLRVGAPVALYFHRLGNSGGGAERVICALANALLKRGFAVHLISWDDENARTFYPLSQGVVWHRLGFSGGIVDKFRRTRSLARLLRDNGIRALIGFVMSNDKTVYTAVKLADVRLVVAERNAPSMYHLRYGKSQRWLTFALLYLADRITLQFPEFAEGYPVSLRDRIEVIPNPVPTASRYARPNEPNPHGRFILLTVSRLDGVQKRLACLVRAFAQVAAVQPDWDLRIIGDGPEEDALRDLSRELGISERVSLERSLPDIFDAYTQAHLFAIPSLWEGFPNALAEALGHGLPAVGFHGAAGVVSLIKDGETGWLAKGLDDETALAGVLGQAMANGEERVRRGALAVESMAAYAPEAQFERWAVLLDSLSAGDTR